jgi:hypothetical protein
MYRNNAAVEHRRRQVALIMLTMSAPSVRKVREALAKGPSPIAVSVGTVERDMQALRAEWKQERFRDMDEFMGQELAGLALAESSAWRILDQQRQPITRTITRTRQVPVRVLREVEGQAPVVVDEIRTLTHTYTEQYTPPPDARTLDTIVRIKERRAKMLGLDPREPGVTVNLIPVTVLEQASLEELDEIERGRIPKRIAQLATGSALPAGPGDAGEGSQA